LYVPDVPALPCEWFDDPGLVVVGLVVVGADALPLPWPFPLANAAVGSTVKASPKTATDGARRSFRMPRLMSVNLAVGKVDLSDSDDFIWRCGKGRNLLKLTGKRPDTADSNSNFGFLLARAIRLPCPARRDPLR
jgi:hypothetical protein